MRRLAAIIVPTLAIGFGVVSSATAGTNGPVQVRIVDYVTGNVASVPTFDASATDYKVQLHPYVLNLENSLEYVFNVTGCTGDCGSASAAVGSGIGAWSVSGLTVTQNNSTSAKNPCTDSPNSVTWSSLGTNVVGETIPCFDPDTGQIYGFDMIFNSSLSWSDCGSVGTCTGATSGEFSIAATAGHEGGHVYGLGHVHALKDFRLTMYFGLGPNDYGPATLGCGDRLGVNALYGTSLTCTGVPLD